MNEFDIKRLALVLALQAEIEGMKANNNTCKLEQRHLVHNEGDFQHMASKLRDLAYTHNEQL